MRLTAADQVPVPLFVVRGDGTLAYVNAAWRKVFDPRIGIDWQSVFEDCEPPVSVGTLSRCISERAPFQFRASARQASGMHGFYDVICQPIETDTSERNDSQVLGWLVDVSPEKSAQAESTAILDTAVDAIIIIDEHGTIETFNQAASDLFGYARADMIGKPITTLMPEPHRSEHGGYLKHYLATGETHIIGIGRELVALHSDGTQIPIYLAVSEIAGEQRRFTGIIRDLTEQHANRQALAEQRERLAHVGRLSTMGEMTASIAHEINQPLTAISMYAQAGIKMLEHGARDGDRERDGDHRPEPNLGKLKEALDKLTTQSLRAGAVIERIQRFSRSQETQKESVSINELIVDLMKLAESDARLHDIQLDLDLEAGLPRLFCDPIQIQQVLLNLVRNGIDAMGDIDCANGRTISIYTRLSQPDELEIGVRDSGPGVAEDQKNLLFTPFHTTKKEGMGLGLSICRSIISEHGGVLTYVGNQPDPGASFYFILPVTPMANVE